MGSTEQGVQEGALSVNRGPGPSALSRALLHAPLILGWLAVLLSVGVAFYVWNQSIEQRQLVLQAEPGSLEQRFDTITKTLSWSEFAGARAVPMLAIPILLALLGLWSAWSSRLGYLALSGLACLAYGFVTYLTIGALVLPIAVVLCLAGAVEAGLRRRPPPEPQRLEV